MSVSSVRVAASTRKPRCHLRNRAGFGRRAGVHAWLLLALVGCSAGQDFSECQSHEDCAAGLVCSPEEYCVSQVDLFARHGIYSSLCTKVLGNADPLSAETILVGALLPVTGPDSTRGIAQSQALILAVDELNSVPGGLGGRGRQLAVLACDTESNPTQAVQAATHLARLGIPAAVGPSSDAEALSVVESVSALGSDPNPLGLLTVSPSASSILLSGLGTNARFVRPMVSDLALGSAVAALLSQREAYDLPLEGAVAVLYPQSPTGVARRDAVLAALPATVVQIGYPPSGQFDNASESIQALEPRIIVLLAEAQAAEILRFVELLSKSSGFVSPIEWIVTDSARTATLFDLMGAGDGGTLDPSSTLARVRGVAPDLRGTDYASFATRFASRFGGAQPGAPSAATAYDATVLVGLALSAADSALRLPSYQSGHVLEGLSRLSSGELSAATPAGINAGALALNGSPSATIDYDGASGPVDLGAETEPEKGAVALFRPDWATQSFLEEPLLDASGAWVAPQGSPETR